VCQSAVLSAHRRRGRGLSCYCDRLVVTLPVSGQPVARAGAAAQVALDNARVQAPASLQQAQAQLQQAQANKPQAEQEYRRQHAVLRLGRAQEAQEVLNYRGTVLNALREVEDALVAYRTDRAQRDKLPVAVRSGEMTLYLARDAYTHGLQNFIQVLDAERTLIGSRQQLVQADVTLTNDVVTLYDALGGGWTEDAGDVRATQTEQAPPIVPAALDSVAAAPPH
jgi:hypothetical protein